MSFHGSCAALGDDAVVLLGPPGSGKSDLLLQLLDRGFSLVGDDQLIVEHGRVRSATSVAGLLEIRGVGIFEMPYRDNARLRLVVMLEGVADRLPMPQYDATLGVPSIMVDPRTVAAAIKISWALDAVCGRKTQYCGAFAA
ncbi:HPr kinase/phosphorylase [Acidiphilium sp.]|uniref:HPr kinase/phosphorylase n=1 Tax=Acidiphilium sp. TaxID=527 RepID=UPI003CFFB6E9